jgi:hypothetical protein
MIQKTCDVCGKQSNGDNPIVSKLFIAPILPGKTRATHSYYTGHMDIGKCCIAKVTGLGNWQKRQTREAYNDGRRLRSVESPPDALEARRRRTAGEQK